MRKDNLLSRLTIYYGKTRDSSPSAATKMKGIQQHTDWVASNKLDNTAKYIDTY